MQLNYKTKQILACVSLLCFVFISHISAQTTNLLNPIERAEANFDNGDYVRSVEIVEKAISAHKDAKSGLNISKALDLLARSQISLQKYEEAEKSLNAALEAIPLTESISLERAQIFLHFAWLFRAQRKFAVALEYSQKAISLPQNNPQILAEHYLNVGRTLFASSYDVSAIIWLEKAEMLLAGEKMSSAKLEVYRFLALAWSSKLNYQVALIYARKGAVEAEHTRFKHKYRQALFDLATILSESGQQTSALLTLEKGLALALADNNSFHTGNFLTSLLLNSLDTDNLDKAAAYLDQLEKWNGNKDFLFEILLGKAIISAFTRNTQRSNEIFAQLEKMEHSSDFVLPGWNVKIAKRNGDWERVIQFNQKLLDLCKEGNFRDELPAIHLDFALAYFHLNNLQLSKVHLEKSLGFVEEIRKSENNNLSLGLFETYHNAYRLLAQLNFENPQESFELVDFLKARLLSDRVNNAAIKRQSVISPEIRRKLEDISLEYIEGQIGADEIDRNEKLITNSIPDLNLVKPELMELNKLQDLRDTAVISYFFTLDKKLIAFVWEKDKNLKTFYLPITEDAAEDYAKKTPEKIRNFIFFKKDGKEMYDKLLKPLNISAKRLILVPDKSLWKIPFQALSPDGEKYLIETTTISYAPSVSIVLEQLKHPRLVRKTFQAFANSSYDGQSLQFVNAEATSVAGLFNSRPVLNASIADFQRVSDKSDILHFSMHAQVDSDQPLDSFLGFRNIGNDRGRLTVEDLLNTKLKKGSLVFLASCDTNNVLNGEGLVSLAWGMMGSGATSVVSAQWEASDKSTQKFSELFYRELLKGSSTSSALQTASIEMIHDKASGFHEPYFWGIFTLLGDFR